MVTLVNAAIGAFIGATVTLIAGFEAALWVAVGSVYGVFVWAGGPEAIARLISRKPRRSRVM